VTWELFGASTRPSFPLLMHILEFSEGIFFIALQAALDSPPSFPVRRLLRKQVLFSPSGQLPFVGEHSFGSVLQQEAGSSQVFS